MSSGLCVGLLTERARKVMMHQNSLCLRTTLYVVEVKSPNMAESPYARITLEDGDVVRRFMEFLFQQNNHWNREHVNTLEEELAIKVTHNECLGRSVDEEGWVEPEITKWVGAFWVNWKQFRWCRNVDYKETIRKTDCGERDEDVEVKDDYISFAQERDYSKRKAESTGDPELWSKYRTVRNYVNNLREHLRKEHYANVIFENQNTPGKLWKVVKQMMGTWWWVQVKVVKRV